MTEALPSDWSAVGYDGPPVPGDPAVITSIVKAFHDFSADLDTQNTYLKALHDELGDAMWKGPAAEAIKPKLDDLPPKLDKVVASFKAAGEALATYGTKHKHLQEESLEVLRQAQAEMRTHAAAQQAVGVATTPHMEPAGTTHTKAELDAAHAKVTDAKNALSASQGRLDGFHAQCRELARTRDHAAQDACHALDSALDKGIKNKHGFFHAISSFIHDHADLLKQISSALNAISGVMGILALCTCWIPVVGEVFEAASLITGALALGIDLALALNRDGSWSSVIVDGLALGAGGASHVLGRAAEVSRAAKGAEAAKAISKTERAGAQQAFKEGAALGKSGDRAGRQAARTEGRGLRASSKEHLNESHELANNAPKPGETALGNAGKQSLADAKRGFLPEGVSPSAFRQNLANAARNPGEAARVYTRGTGAASATYRGASTAVGAYGVSVTVADSVRGFRSAAGDGDPGTVIGPRPYHDPVERDELDKSFNPRRFAER